MSMEMLTQVQKVHRVPYRVNPQRNVPRHILITSIKIRLKNKNIKTNKGKATNSKRGKPHKIISCFFSKTLQA